MLDKNQRAIVEEQLDVNMLVVAGAGSGKTRVLVERVKFLLAMGVAPHNIVAITFTNMAAEEMKERLADVSVVDDMFIGTIHSFANRIYRTSGVNYDILTTDVEQLVYEEALTKPECRALSYKRWLQYRDLQVLVESNKADERLLQSFLLPSEQSALTKALGHAELIMKRDNIITFDQLLKFATQYYESLGASIEHILVDEFQDIDTLEYKFIKALNAGTYFFVGDDWQAIYGFKGGNVDIFKSLVRSGEFRVYYLVNNYRNAQAIIDLGHKVITQVDDKIDKHVCCCNQVKNPIVTVRSKDGAYAAIIRILSAEKDCWRDWFILTRSNKELYNMADLLDDHNIDYCFIKRSELSLEELRGAMKSNQVKLMTVHAAKGLESKKVMLYGNFPVIEPRYRRNSEERRVLYVGITRAIEELHIFN